MTESHTSLAEQSAVLHDEAARHFIDRVRSSELHREPFPYMVCSDIFPKRYYRLLIQSLPPLSAYRPAKGWKKYRKRNKRACGVEGNRYDLFLHATSENHERVDETALDSSRAEHFIRALTCWMVSNATVSILIRQTTRFEEAVTTFGVESELRLVREEGSAFIEPHVDKAFKYLTMIFYLGDSKLAGPAKPGTTLYELDSKPFTDGQALRLPRPVTDRLSAVCEVPYWHNTALVIPRYESSVHGVGAAAFDGARNTMHLYIQAALQEEYAESGYAMPHY